MWKKPTLIIDTKKAERNIEKMQQKAARSHVVFRPHFKTHQNAKIGELFQKKGITSIAVSSVSMAIFFYKHGWKDITIAFPINHLEITDINKLASDVNLNLLVESNYSAEFLTQNLKSEAGVFIKIDTGYHRTGLKPDSLEEINAIINTIRKPDKLLFKGFLTHAGHTYMANSKAEIKSIYQSIIDQLNHLKKEFVQTYPNLTISYGDTPSCSIIKDLSEIVEIRPGNFVYYDIMQYDIGSCTIDEIAVAVACPVVAVHPKRSELVIYGGAVHLSKECLTDSKGIRNYGLVVNVHKNGWSDPIQGAYVRSVTQEHGIIFIPDLEQKNFKPGDMIGILPIHSCLTANLLKEDTVLLS